MASGFRIYDKIYGYSVDMDDILIRRDYFAQGNLSVWGKNDIGQVGIPTAGANVTTPTNISGIWTDVICGPSTTVALTKDGSLWMWGYGNSQPTPTQYGTAKWRKIYAVSKPNTYYNGYNDYFYGSQINGTFYKIPLSTDPVVWTNAPVLCISADFASPMYNSFGIQKTKDTRTFNSTGGATVNGDKVTMTYSAGVINFTSDLFSGMTVISGNSVGEFAAGTKVVSVDSLTQFTIDKVALSTLTSASRIYGYFPDEYNTLWYWNDTTAATQIGSDTNWKIVSSTPLGSRVILLKSDNTLWFMDGGTSASPYYLTPTAIFPSTRWRNVSCNMSRVAGIQTDGTLWTFAFISDGSGNVIPGNLVQQGTDTNWKQVAMDSYVPVSPDSNFNICAVKVDGTLWAMGGNTYGQCGQGDTNPVTTMTQIGTGTNWRYVVGRDGGFAAIADQSLP